MPAESVYAWARQAELLSLGIVCLDAARAPSELYAVRPLDKRLRSRCTRFVVEEVLPHLEAASPTMCFRTPAELHKPLRVFLAERRRASGKPPAIAVDWAGDAILLGDALPPATEVLLLEGIPDIKRAMETFFTGDYRRQTPFTMLWRCAGASWTMSLRLTACNTSTLHPYRTHSRS